MSRARLLLLFLILVPAGCRAEAPDASNVKVNSAGWPLTTYVVYAGTLGPGSNPNGHSVAYGIVQGGWRRYVDEQIQPLLDGPNPPARIVLHCVGPAWPRVRDGQPRRAGGSIMRWFTYEWPLTVAEGRPREDGAGRWPPLPSYIEDFSETWRSVADGSRSGGFPIETYAYTGMIQTPWMEALRESDPEAYREKLLRVATFFQEAGFSGMYVDASSDGKMTSEHLGLQTLKQINDRDGFFLGVESYPPAVHDATTGPLPYFISHGALKSQHPGFPFGPRPTWQTKLQRRGLVVWHNSWGGGAYRLTPERARQTVAAGADIGVSWVRWRDLAPRIPPQQLRRISIPAR